MFSNSWNTNIEVHVLQSVCNKHCGNIFKKKEKKQSSISISFLKYKYVRQKAKLCKDLL